MNEIVVVCLKDDRMFALSCRYYANSREVGALMEVSAYTKRFVFVHKIRRVETEKFEAFSSARVTGRLARMLGKECGTLVCEALGALNLRPFYSILLLQIHNTIDDIKRASCRQCANWYVEQLKRQQKKKIIIRSVFKKFAEFSGDKASCAKHML